MVRAVTRAVALPAAVAAALLLALLAPAASHQADAPAEGREIFAAQPLSVLEGARSGLEVAGEMIDAGDAAGARHAAEFSAGHFAQGMAGLDLAGVPPAAVADVHITLLDLPALAESPSSGDVAAALSALDGLGSPESDARLAVVELLTAADEQYAEAAGGNDAAYAISVSLLEKARAIFEGAADESSMLDVEQLSFFADLSEAAGSRDSFVKVGTLVGAIQRDLLGTDVLEHDQDALYENIRQLYARLLEAVDAGDYELAEELAIEAYLENFEYLEPALEFVDAEFMYKLEIEMREDLRTMIREGRDPADIREFLEGTIIPSLDQGQIKVGAAAAASSSNPAWGAEAAEIEGPPPASRMGQTTSEEQSAVRDEIDFIRDSLDEMLAHYEAGDAKSAYAAARTAYLDSYEHVEVPLRPIAPDFTLEVEYQFAELRNLIKHGAPYGEVREMATNIERNLDESERLVTGTGQLAPFIAFSASFAIIFREGLEAVLILGAIMTYLEASRNGRFKKYVHYGVVAAIAATAATWFVASYLIEISGADRELIEAIAALSATAVLFYVSFWILNKIEHKKWMEFVKAKVWQATTTGGVMVFVMLSFFTVYREGFETVLFYQAMFGFAKYMEAYVGLGFLIGMASLLGLYFVMRRLGRRLPLRVLFGLTMGIGAYLSIAFLGNAVRELQVLDIVPYTSMIGTVPRLDINMATMTGIYPTLETVVAQIALLGVYLAGSAYVLVLRPRRARMIAQMRKSRAGAGGDGERR